MKRSLWIALAAVAAPAVGGCEEPEPPIEVKVVPALDAESSPPPVSGGHMTVTRDGAYAVVADSHADAVYFVSLSSWELAATVALEPGDEPGRVIEGRDGEIHVALRRGGAVATITASSLEMTRTPVCPAPRGMAYDADRLHVACAGGELVTLSGGEVVRELRLEPDLRDVIAVGDQLYVSQFRSARIFSVDAEGAIAAVGQPDHYTSPNMLREFDGAIAWRMHKLPSGDLMVLHQRGLSTEIPTGAPVAGLAYYGGSCDEVIVHAAATVYRPGGLDRATPPNRGTLGNLVLPVDMAVSPDGQRAAFLGAGNESVVELSLDEVLNGDAFDNCFSGVNPVKKVLGEPLSLSYTPSGQLIVHTRQPASVLHLDPSTGQISQQVMLPSAGRSWGHALFHKAAGELSPIACASCHPEGREDGRVWKFENIGDRRTQTVSGGVLDTLPLHWDGELDTMHDLMSEVFVNRMGGGEQPADRIDALGEWVNAIDSLPPSIPVDPEAVARGAALFADAEVGCAGCHAGEALTTNATVNVGTGKPFQVPSLRDVRQRAPFMHDGCAVTMRDRFVAPCGGTEHGNTAQLTETQLDDLLAYLDTL